MRSSIFAIGAAITALAACSQNAAPGGKQTAAASTPAPVEIKAPAGRYELDPTHSSLSFSINHVGLSNYVARFTKYHVTLELDSANLAGSSVVATLDPTSIRTDYSADYRALHPDSKFQSWDEDLAQSDKFFDAGRHPQIEFRSTHAEQTAPGALTIAGDLILLGQTKPITLEATLVGSAPTHPFYKGGGAIGFSATGTFDRSSFGMNYLLKPPLVGDVVTVRFEGEFRQVISPAAQPAG